VVAKLDRFGRSLVDSLAVIDRIRAAGGVFVSVGDGLDLTTDTGKLVLRIMLSMAEWELDRIRSQWDAARERAVARGVHLGAKRPAGYRRGRAGVLRRIDAEAAVIAEAFRRRAEGAPVREVCRYLDSTGVPTVHGNGHWTDGTVRNILANRIYLGEIRHGEFLNASAHEPLVDPVTWQRAQSPRVMRPTKAGRKPSLLSGILRCAGCRLAMGAEFQPRAGRRVRTYHCTGRSSAGPCPAPAHVSGTVAEPYVEEVAFALARRRARLRPDRRLLERLERKVADAESALAAYRDDPRIMRSLGGERYAAGLETRRARVDRLLVEVGAERSRVAAGEEASRGLAEVWPAMTIDERRAALAQVIDCVFVSRGHRSPDERLFVCARGEGPAELPTRGADLHVSRPFDPQECRRSRPPMAISPTPAPSWGEQRLREGLAGFFADGACKSWPPDDVFAAAGHGQLIEQVWRSGGPQRWAPEIGVAIRAGRQTLARWTDRRVEATLEYLLHGRTTWPTRAEFAAAGYDGLHTWLRHHGGMRAWAARYGLPNVRGGGGRRKWTEQSIERSLRALASGQDAYPTGTQFSAAGLGGLYRALGAGHDHDEWARRLGLPRPRSRRNRPRLP